MLDKSRLASRRTPKRSVEPQGKGVRSPLQQQLEAVEQRIEELQHNSLVVFAEKIDSLKANLTYAKLEVTERRELAVKLGSLTVAYENWMRGYHAIVDSKLSREVADVKAKTFSLEKRLSKVRKAIEEDQATLNKTLEQKSMTKNEIENRLVEKTEHVIHKEKAEAVLQRFGGTFFGEKGYIDDYVAIKQQVGGNNEASKLEQKINSMNHTLNLLQRKQKTISMDIQSIEKQLDKMVSHMKTKSISIVQHPY